MERKWISYRENRALHMQVREILQGRMTIRTDELQRIFKLGYNRASALMDSLSDASVVLYKDGEFIVLGDGYWKPDEDDEINLFLTLTHHWYEETIQGRKRIEYREPTDRWKKLILERKEFITRVTFGRGYSQIRTTFAVTDIDQGPCPIEGWDKPDYIRIHFA